MIIVIGNGHGDTSSNDVRSLGNAEYPLLPLFPGVMAPDSVLSIGQIERFDIQTECKELTYA